MPAAASLRHIISASRTEAIQTIPPFVLAPLVGLVSYRPMTEASFNRFFLPGSARAEPVERDPLGLSSAQMPTQLSIATTEPDDVPPPPTIPAHLDETFRMVQAWTKNLRSLNDVPARIRLAHQLRRHSKGLILLPSALSFDSRSLESNCRLALEYLAHMLDPSPKKLRRLKASTVSSYWSNLLQHLLIHSHTTNLLSLTDPDDVVNFVAGSLRTIRVPSTRASYRNKWSQFLQFLHPRGVALLNCHDPRMYVAQDHRPYALLHYEDIDHVSALISTQCDVELARDLIQTTTLAGILGLRLHEIHNIALQDVSQSQNLLFLSIPKSKSSAGIRTIPLSLLLPSLDLQRFVNHWARRALEVQGDLTRPFLRLAEGDLTVRALGTRMASYIKQIHPQSSLHDFRHTAASCLLLAWWLARYGQPTKGLPFLFTHRGFHPERLAQLRTLFDGPQPARPRCGGDLFDPILFAIARILGHASPDTTVSTYLHTFEIVCILSQSLRSNGGEAIGGLSALNQSQVANLLQCSSPTAGKILSRVMDSIPTSSARVSEHQVGFPQVLEAQLARLSRHPQRQVRVLTPQI